MIQLTRSPRLFGAFVCLSFCLPLFGMAQSNSPEDVAENLKGRVVFIRGMYLESDLKFDSQGNPIGTATPGPFFLSTFKVEKSHLKGTNLEFSGHRGIFIYDRPDVQGQTPRFVSLPAEVHIRVVGAPDRVENLQALLNRIFATDLKEILADKTPEQQQALLTSFPVLAPATPSELHAKTVSALPPGGQPLSASGRGNNKVELKRTDGVLQVNQKERDGVIPPRLIHAVPSVDPLPHKSGAICLVHVVVETNGFPNSIRIAKSAGSDRDSEAIVEVSQYRFAPATRNNEPVPFGVVTEFNLHGNGQYK